MAEVGRAKGALEDEITSLTSQPDGLQISARKAREEFAQIDIHRKTKRTEFAAECAALEEQIKARQEKLAALEGAIQEKAGKLGGLIARELV